MPASVRGLGTAAAGLHALAGTRRRPAGNVAPDGCWSWVFPMAQTGHFRQGAPMLIPDTSTLR